MCGIAAVLAGAVLAAPGPIPVVLDTDIGDDIDDTWALTMLLKCPQLDLKLVTTTYGRAESRARLIARLLTVAKRTDVAIGLGAGGRGGTHRQQDWIKDYKLEDYPGKVHQDGVKALIEAIHGSVRPMTVIAIGPVQTLAAALDRDPSIAPKAHFAGMHGSVGKGYDGGAPSAEWNVRCDVAAARKVLSAPWKTATITPLDTCGLVRLSGQRFQTVWTSQDGLAKALMENYRIWAKKDALDASSVLFDTCAVYLALPGPKDLMKLEDLPLSVDDKGFTVVDEPGGKKLTAATEWKSLDGFRDLLVKTLTGPTTAAPASAPAKP